MDEETQKFRDLLEQEAVADVQRRAMRDLLITVLGGVGIGFLLALVCAWAGVL